MTGNGLRELTMDKNHFGMLSVGYHITDKRKTTDSDKKSLITRTLWIKSIFRYDRDGLSYYR